MTYKIILFSVLSKLVCIGDLNCQGFIKKYNYANYIFPKLTSLYNLNHNFWAFGSVTDTIDGEDHLTINKIDENGNLIFYSVFKDDTIRHWFNQGITYYNGKLFTVTNDPYFSASLVSYDTENKLFEKVLSIKSIEKNGNFFACYDLIQDNNNDLVFASATQTEDVNSNRSFIQINKYSPYGNNKWTYTYFIPNYSLYPVAILILPNNDIIISCSRQADIYDEYNSNSIRPLFLHLSNDGKLQKIILVNTVMNLINDFKIDEDGNYICAASDTVHTNRSDFYNSVPVVASINPKGFINWVIDVTDRRLSYNSFEEMVKIKYDIESKLYYSVGMGRFVNEEGGSSSEVNLVLVCLNSKGEIIWNHRIKNGLGTTNDYCYDMSKLEKEILLVGGVRNVSNLNNIYSEGAFCIRLNNDGCILDDCLDFKIDTTSLILYVAPNPVKDYLRLFSREIEPINISLFNVNGVLIYHEEKKFLEGVIEIPLTKIIPGLYFLSAYTTGSNKKFETKVFLE